MSMYGKAPIAVRSLNIAPKELCFTMYMPIKLPGKFEPTIPVNYLAYERLIIEALSYEYSYRQDIYNKYVYLTTKRLWVQPNAIGGRPGWHTDGFGTNDINYIWCDTLPTEFCIQPFELSEDHNESMVQMEQQAKPENIRIYPEQILLRLDPSVVHRCPTVITPCYRTFARISISDDIYNMEGNGVNHLLDYNWTMQPRNTNNRNDVAVRK